MKQMVYTVKIVTNLPIVPSVMASEIQRAIAGVDAVEVVNYRVLPTKKTAKEA